ncbi:MAG: hypothetical protein DMG02_00450 [Acidobacteria bacterium]|nr:MAG: hypothetical protein DMG03_12860 [Acidobacteriota bacterium]PYQ92695.1 MAG: hypothetical protein DMG02_00450 [Acidobacteriota bacterium]PYR05796.1 MAG: hypothetical protein DMF99_27485 [Acidobacteriota bacterium]PYR07105.1 MAG: hypothetical protein DMG00_17395 [Acidobacteriota bacterium]
MIAVLAHDLQHVREVLDPGIPLDGSAMDSLFNRIGSRLRGTEMAEQYETAAAQKVTTLVTRELEGNNEKAPEKRREDKDRGRLAS